ncbi:MAG TPA: LytR C-terminal domain-containing protein [Longimicrobiales bacterium]|nr:LytR C-terminal domain-containing protein [Longimicrobiales bacterium]
MAKKRRRPVRDRVEVGLLFLALLGVAAFIGSFVAGLDWSAPTAVRAGTPVEPAANVPLPAAPEAEGAARLRVEVLNGAGRAGIAREATDRLRDAGLDVVFFGNAPRFDHATSVVLARTGEVAAARRVADLLGIAAVREEADADLYLDVTVVLGADWVAPVPAPAVPDENGRLERAIRGLLERP